MKRELGLVVLSVAVLTAGCRWQDGKIDGSGTIECTQVLVSPQVAGRILELPVQEGDTLKKGDLVARLDPKDFELKRDEARAGLAQARAQLDLIKAGAREEDIQRAREQVREAKAAAKMAEDDRVRITQLFEKKSATEKQADDAKSNADRTSAALAAAEQNLAKLTKGNRPEEIRLAEAQLELAQARLAQVEKAIADCTVTAPMDGVVTEKIREEGELVSIGTPIITLSRQTDVWLSIYVPESRLGKVKIGQPARVKIDGDKRLFDGTVTFVSPEAEFTPKNVQTPDERAKLVYRVKITLSNSEGIFKPGMPADGYLQ